MRRTLPVLCLILLALFVRPAPAYASFWAWLEEFSGPGPFKGYAFLLTGCVQDGGLRPSPLVKNGTSPASASGAWRPLGCVYFDRGAFDTAADSLRGFPAIDVAHYDVGAAFRLFDGLDVGAGVGRIRFKANGTTRGKATITPLRLVLRPLLLVTPEQHQQRWMSVFSVYWKETFVVGPLTGTDFGAPAGAFDSPGEIVRSFGVIFDLTSLLPRGWYR